MNPHSSIDSHITALREFNRFYTRKIGTLNDGILNSRYPLAEVRVLYEIAHRKAPLAKEIAVALALDAGYLSRILQRFARRGWLSRERATDDARKTHLQLSAKGADTFAHLDKLAQREMAQMLAPLNTSQQTRLRANLEEAHCLLQPTDETGKSELVLRQASAGDIGWIVHRHAVHYTREYGWNHEFEALVADVCSQFLRRHDQTYERCWIAEYRGAPVGSIMLVKDSTSCAKLRLLLVEPSARGLGVGRRLVEECIAFARASGYRSIRLWTQSNLTAARKLYAAAGFKLIKSKANHSFGVRLQSETWDLALTPRRPLARPNRGTQLKS